MRYGLIPEGPARRAVVFGGSNIHVLKPDYVDGGTRSRWRRRPSSHVDQPGMVDAAQLGRLEPRQPARLQDQVDEGASRQIKFLDVTTSMLPNGIPFPVMPEAPEIMNIIVPDMLQNALTGKMTVDAAADDAAKKVKSLLGGL